LHFQRLIIYEVSLSAFNVTMLCTIKLKIRFLNDVNNMVLVAARTHRRLKVSTHFPSEARCFD